MNSIIDSRQLLSFSTLIQMGSFTEAAQKLNLTQSAISHSIKKLESELSCKLITRSGRDIFLTEDGEEFLKDAQLILHQMDETRTRLQDRTNWGKGRLRIGSSTTGCQYILPNVLREFKECFPDCQLNITPADTPELISKLEFFEIDLAIIVQPEDLSNMNFHSNFVDELILVASPIHPLARKANVRLSEIAQQRFILYNKSSLTFQKIENFFSSNGISMENSIELGSMEAIKELIKINYGISFLADWTVADELAKGSLVRIPIGKKKIQRNWGIAYSKEKKLSIIEETFLGISESFSHKS